MSKSINKLRVNFREKPKLGVGRVKIIEILRHVLQNNILNTKEIVGKVEGFFALLLSLMRNY